MVLSIQQIIEYLSPLERKIVPYLNFPYDKIKEKTSLDDVSLLRSLQFMENKGILNIKRVTEKIIDLGTNGIYYKKNSLPERRFLEFLENHAPLGIEEAKEKAGLSENEFTVSIGILKNKELIKLKDGKIIFLAKKEEITKKSLEEQFIESLPLKEESLTEEQRYSYEHLKKRKEIVEVQNKQIINLTLTDLGKEIAGKKIEIELIEEVTPEIIAEGIKNKKFRRYDLKASVPKITGGKEHFVNQAIEYARSIWLELGFKEMEGPILDTSFWIFDALFTPQDHPARDMQDTFYIQESKGQIPEKEIAQKVKQAHEKGISKSKGWSYDWKEEEAKKLVLRTHTTGISAKTLSKISVKDIPAKYFIIGKVFRNETLDWSHGFEFYQMEGIVIDEKANFKHLLGYLKLFYDKIGFKKIRFRPSFFTYTEPSLEIEGYNEEKKIWIELGGAGIFRPEVVVPLLGKDIPVLAWGQGFDRIIMEYYGIKDLREMYANDIKNLREKKIWTK